MKNLQYTLMAPDPEKGAPGGPPADRGDDLDTKKGPPANEGKDEDLEAKGEDEELSAEEKEAEDLVRKEEEEAEKKRRIRIPKARFDEVVRKAREKEEVLHTKIRDLEKQVGSQKNETDVQKLAKQIDELEDQYEDLLHDGKKEDARKVRRQLNEARERLSDIKSTVKSDAAKREAIDQLKYDSLLAKAEADYPELNPEQEDFSEEKTEEVAGLVEAFMARGYTRHAALDKAIKYVMGAPRGKEDAEAIKKQRETDARKKAADADKKQPPATSKAGMDSDKGGTKDDGGIDVFRMSPDKFDKLTEETKSRLRGDVLA